MKHLKNICLTTFRIFVHISDWLRLQNQDLPNKNQHLNAKQAILMKNYIFKSSIILQIEALSLTRDLPAHMKY